MKYVGAFFIVFVCTLLLANINIHSPKKGLLNNGEKKLKISISSEKKTFNSKDNVEFELTIENASSKFVSISLPAILIPQDHNIKFFLFDQNKKIIKFVGPELKAMWPKETITLLKGYKYSKRFDLRKYYKLNKGVYKLVVKYDSSFAIKTYDLKADAVKGVSKEYFFTVE